MSCSRHSYSSTSLAESICVRVKELVMGCAMFSVLIEAEIGVGELDSLVNFFLIVTLLQWCYNLILRLTKAISENAGIAKLLLGCFWVLGPYEVVRQL